MMRGNEDRRAWDPTVLHSSKALYTPTPFNLEMVTHASLARDWVLNSVTLVTDDDNILAICQGDHWSNLKVQTQGTGKA